MKRILILALVLMFVGLAVFAQSTMAPAPKWNMYNEGDLYADGTNGFGWGPGWGHESGDYNNGWYTQLGLTYDGKDYGYAAQMTFGADLLGGFGSNYQQFFRWFDVYFNLFGGAVKMTGGKIMDFDYDITDFVEGDDCGALFIGSNGTDTDLLPSEGIWAGQFAGLMEIMPVTGLKIGIAAAVPGYNANAYWSAGAAYPTNYLYALAVAVQYSMKDMFTANAWFRANGDTFDVNVAYLGMKNLTLNAEVQNQFGTGQTGYPQNFGWLASVGYTMAPFTAGIMTGGTVATWSGAPTGAAGADWAVEAKVEYTFWSNIGVGARVGYENTNFTSTFIDSGYIAGNVNGLEIYPYIFASFDNGSSFSVGFQWSSGINPQYIGNAAASTSYWGIPIKYTVGF